MPVAQSPAHYINSSKGCPSITEYFQLCCFLVLCATVAALPVVQPHSASGHIFCARNSNSVTFALRQSVCGRECVSEFDGQIRWWKRTFRLVSLRQNNDVVDFR
jgi:hypothetical protein